MFRLIDPDEMVYGERYIAGPYKWYLYFVREIYWDRREYCVFERVKNDKYINQFQILSTSNFYEFVSQKARIQSDMERRAVNQIIRRILGDNCFEW